jgi:hypothetical protein
MDLGSFTAKLKIINMNLWREAPFRFQQLENYQRRIPIYREPVR